MVGTKKRTNGRENQRNYERSKAVEVEANKAQRVWYSRYGRINTRPGV